jgi:3-oxoadipate enol-lactonase
MHEIEVDDGVRLSYVEHGSGPETIVFSHSYLLDWSHFAPQIEALAGRYRCLAYDHRGHGGSTPVGSRYDLEAIYRDGERFVEALAGGPCHFVGLSSGGFVGLRLALRRPDLLRSLTLMATSAEAEPPTPRRRYRLMILALLLVGPRPLVDRVMPLLFGRAFLEDPARHPEVEALRRRVEHLPRLPTARFGAAIFDRPDLTAELPRIATPTLVVVGEDDRAQPPARARHMAERIPGAELAVIPRAGHVCTLEEPAAVNAVLEGFVARLG